MIATIYEVINDRFGDKNKGFDVFIRMILFTLEAYILHLIFDKSVLVSLVIPFAVFFLVFDYWIAYVLIKNRIVEPPVGEKYHWFSYVAKKGWFDNLSFWRDTEPGFKLGMRIGFFIAAILIFVL